MNEQGFSPEIPPEEEIAEQEKTEPTPQELAEACKDVLAKEDCQELAKMEIGDAIGYVFTLLLQAGEDPDEFLKEKGILE